MIKHSTQRFVIGFIATLVCFMHSGCANYRWWRAPETDALEVEDAPLTRPLPAADLRRHHQTKTSEERSTANRRVGSKENPAKDVAVKAATKNAVSASLSDDPTEEEPPPTSSIAKTEPTAPAARGLKPAKLIPRQSLEEMLENNWPVVASHVAKKLEETKGPADAKAPVPQNTQRLPTTNSGVAKDDSNQLRSPLDPLLDKQPLAEATALAIAEEVSASDKKPVDTQVANVSASSRNDVQAVKPAVAHLPAVSEAKAEPAAYQAGDWLKQRDKTIAALEEEIRLARKDAARHSEVPQLETQLRLQYALSGRRDDAARSIDGLHAAEQEFWKHEAFGLVDLLAADRLASESRRYAVALQSLEEAQTHLAAAGTLALKNLAFCRKVDDFGRVEKFDRYDFSRNQEVLLYVEARNFAASKVSGGYETELQGSFRVLDRSGTARSERMLPLDRQTCSNHRRDYYIAYRIYIPTELAPGAYSLELTIEDKKGNKSNNAMLDFNVTK